MQKRKSEREETIALYDPEFLPSTQEEANELARDIANVLQVKIVASTFYQHSGINDKKGGISAVYVVEESFMAFDTYPEYGRKGTMIVRVASCNPNSNFKKLEEYLERKCKPSRLVVYHRGEIPLELAEEK
jgi:S-adenosylmethionine/arginine decarboxylase-like enzyme